MRQRAAIGRSSTMANRTSTQSDCALRSCTRRALLSWRTWLALRLGIQGKIVVTCTILLVCALTATSLHFVEQMRSALLALSGQRAVEVSQTLALARESQQR